MTFLFLLVKTNIFHEDPLNLGVFDCSQLSLLENCVILKNIFSISVGLFKPVSAKVC